MGGGAHFICQIVIVRHMLISSETESVSEFWMQKLDQKYMTPFDLMTSA